MKPLNAHSSADPQNLVGYEVVDRNRKRIGTVRGQWTDPATGGVKFLGVNTVELPGSNHLVPAGAAELDEGDRVIQVPFDAASVRESPGLDAGAEIPPGFDAEILRHYATPATGKPTTGTDPGVALPGSGVGDAAVELVLAEEQLKVGKRIVPSGKVRLRKIVVTEQVQVPVEVRREEVVIERVEAGEAAGPDDVAFDERTLEMVLYEEKPVVSKEVQVSGAVRVRKIINVEHATVQQAVRQEDVQVMRRGETGDWRPDAALGSTPVPAPIHQQGSLGSDPLSGVSPAASVAAVTDPAAVPEGSRVRVNERRDGTGPV